MAPLALTEAWNSAPLAALRDDALAGVRLGLVEAHAPRAQMTPEALAVWDRAVSDLRSAGAMVEIPRLGARNDINGGH